MSTATDTRRGCVVSHFQVVCGCGVEGPKSELRHELATLANAAGRTFHHVAGWLCPECRKKKQPASD